MGLVQNSFIICLLVVCAGLTVIAAETPKQDASKLSGHLEAFGNSGSRKEIEVKYEFPEAYDFMVNYVQPLKPLKLKGAAKNTRAVREWTDEYLLSLDVPSDSVVELETKKKESRDQETTAMHFHDFLKVYNYTEHYMVDDVPPYLSPDVTVPCSVQCHELLDKGLAFTMMWFSSGGTKSVVHTDSFDNINCLVRGQKTFVMMDPARDREKIKLSTYGAYSNIDVDNVDLTKYPELAEAEFYHVHLEAGDCLYIPYMWIHQVRSYNSNVAINFWWNHYEATSLLTSGQGSVCQTPCDPNLTLDMVKLLHDDQTLENPYAIRDWLREIVLNGPMTLVDTFEHMKKELGVEKLNLAAERMVIEMFDALDFDKDSLFSREEHEQVPLETWEAIQRSAGEVMESINNGETDEERERREEIEERREYAEYVAASRKDEL